MKSSKYSNMHEFRRLNVYLKQTTAKFGRQKILLAGGSSFYG